MAIPENPDTDQALREIARLFDADDHAQARKLCEQVLAKSPDDADALIWLARIAIRVAMAHRRTRMRQWGELDEDAVLSAVGSDPSPQAQAEAAESLSICRRMRLA